MNVKVQKMIKVLGTQSNAEGEKNEIELITEGKYYKKNNCYYLVYEESELSGMEGSTTTLKIEGKNKVSMQRFGTMASKLVFEEGKNYSSQYCTEFGNFELDIFTKKLDIAMVHGEKGESLEIHYDMEIKGLVNTWNELKIEFI